VREFADLRPVAILVDDLHFILGTGAGRWLLGVIGQLSGILVVHARRPSPARDQLGHAIVVPLTPMSPGETRDFMRHELPPGWAHAEAESLGSLVFETTGGYPVWVGA
jgi:hypothetical protein